MAFSPELLRIRRWRGVLLATLMVVMACARSTRAPQGAVDPDAAVYSAVLDSLYPRERDGRIPFIAQPLTSRSMGSNWARRLGRLTANDLSGADTTMIARLVALEPEPRSPRNVLAGRRGLHWIDSSQVGEHPTRRLDSPVEILSGVWLSRVVYSADGQTAMLYESLECGGLCGHGEIVILRRHASGNWRIVKTLRDYVS